MTIQQAKAARRKARQDPRYASNRAKDATARTAHYQEKVRREQERAQRSKKK